MACTEDEVEGACRLGLQFTDSDLSARTGVTGAAAASEGELLSPAFLSALLSLLDLAVSTGEGTSAGYGIVLGMEAVGVRGAG